MLFGDSLTRYVYMDECASPLAGPFRVTGTELRGLIIEIPSHI